MSEYLRQAEVIGEGDNCDDDDDDEGGGGLSFQNGIGTINHSADDDKNRDMDK